MSTFHSVSDIDYYQFEMPAKSRFYLGAYLVGDALSNSFEPSLSYSYQFFDDQQTPLSSGSTSFPLIGFEHSSAYVPIENQDSYAKTFYVAISETNAEISQYLVYLLDAGLDLDEDGFYSKEEFSILDPNDGNSNIIP